MHPFLGGLDLVQGLDGAPNEAGGLQLTYKWDTHKRRRADLSWLKAAYIVAFAIWGYSYAFSPALRVVRQQLGHPEDEIIRQFKLDKPGSPRQRGCPVRC
jgi:hypothetical protein